MLKLLTLGWVLLQDQQLRLPLDGHNWRFCHTSNGSPAGTGPVPRAAGLGCPGGPRGEP
jgi:hypothetical protein